MTIDDVLVEDEPAVLILEALLSLKPSDGDADGMATLTGTIGGDSGAALLHALGRIEAKLRADDMRSFLPGAYTQQTHGRTAGRGCFLHPRQPG